MSNHIALPFPFSARQAASPHLRMNSLANSAPISKPLEKKSNDVDVVGTRATTYSRQLPYLEPHHLLSHSITSTSAAVFLIYISSGPYSPLVAIIMTFDFSALEPMIHQILSAPGTDLLTISAKRVRRQLSELDPSLSAEFLKENKDEVDLVIAGVFEKINAQREENEEDQEEANESDHADSEMQEDDDDVEADADEGLEEAIPDVPEKKATTPKKAKKSKQETIGDAELARKLSTEINARSRRSTGKAARGSTNGKKTPRARKSAAMVDSGDESETGTTKAKPKKKSAGGVAKGGFAKEYILR